MQGAGIWNVGEKRCGQSVLRHARRQVTAFGAYLGAGEYMEPLFAWSSDVYVNGTNPLGLHVPWKSEERFETYI